ncbi:MAG: hypothetical protein JST39_22710 [Bacteroidetes bacterium]|nr:hypothetical protein [Bacteroidota bacterium]
MHPRPLYILGLLLLCAAGLLLYLVLEARKPNDENNGFTRRLQPQPATLLYELATGEPIYRIAGSTEHRFYFTGKDPRVIYAADQQLHRLPPDTIPFPLTNRVIVAYDVKVDSPQVQLYANNLSAIFTGHPGDTAISKVTLPTRLFTGLVSLSSGSLVLRAFDSSGEKQVFKKIIPGLAHAAREVTIIGNRSDAGFSADGLLRYDSTGHRVLFVQFYQNRFYCMDTNLTLLYSARTIDTINNNPIITRRFATPLQKGSLMPAVPLHIINRACVTDGHNIYILSTLRADNEEAAGFAQNAAVDVYALDDGRYRHSFYLPNLHGEKAQNLYFMQNRLLVLYTGYIAAFSIPSS